MYACMYVCMYIKKCNVSSYANPKMCVVSSYYHSRSLVTDLHPFVFFNMYEHMVMMMILYDSLYMPGWLVDLTI